MTVQKFPQQVLYSDARSKKGSGEESTCFPNTEPEITFSQNSYFNLAYKWNHTLIVMFMGQATETKTCSQHTAIIDLCQHGYREERLFFLWWVNETLIYSCSTLQLLCLLTFRCKLYVSYVLTPSTNCDTGGVALTLCYLKRFCQHISHSGMEHLLNA